MAVCAAVFKTGIIHVTTPDIALWLRAKPIIDAALDVTADARDAFCVAHCAGDEALLTEVRAYLKVDADATSPQMDTLLSLEKRLKTPYLQGSSALSGTRIGPYLLRNELGHGGMSVVFAAERVDGAYEQTVAIKLMHASFDPASATKLARERQLLASLNHPNIARLLDGGVTDNGISYLVMERVQGVRIDEFARSLSLAEKIEIVLPLFEAVQHAHQQLIVHRDIKPSNVLVTADGVPKLLDFGISRLIESELELAAGTQYTQTVQPVFTPRYASPEQLRGESSGVASDIYSLGVMLFEVVTKCSPFDVLNTKGDTQSSLSVIRALQDAIPRLASNVAPLDLAPKLKGDLDAIFAKALARDAHARYPSVAAFGADLKRWLQGIPVEARTQTPLVRSWMFIKRNQTVSALVAALVLSLCAGIAVSTWKSLQESRARAFAEERNRELHQLAGKVLFEHFDQAAALPGTIGLQEKIAADSLAYLKLLEGSAGDDPALLRDLAAGYERLGTVYGSLFRASRAKPQDALDNLQRALRLRESLAARFPESIIDAEGLSAALSAQADYEMNYGKAKNAAQLVDRALALPLQAVTNQSSVAQLKQSSVAAHNRLRLVRMRAMSESCAGMNSSRNSSVALNIYAQHKPFVDNYQLAFADDEQAMMNGLGSLFESATTAGCVGRYALADAELQRVRDGYAKLAAKSATPNPFLAQMAMMEIEIGSMHYEQGDLVQAAHNAEMGLQQLLALREYRELNEKSDTGLSVRRLVAEVKTGRYLAESPDSVHRARALPVLESALKVADEMLKAAPQNGFAFRLRVNAENGANLLRYQLQRSNGRGGGERLRAAQRELVVKVREGAQAAQLAPANRARLLSSLYISLAEMEDSEAACSAIRNAFENLAIALAAAPTDHSANLNFLRLGLRTEQIGLSVCIDAQFKTQLKAALALIHLTAPENKFTSKFAQMISVR
jgi:serine/threonine protein kinase